MGIFWPTTSSCRFCVLTFYATAARYLPFGLDTAAQILLLHLAPILPWDCADVLPSASSVLLTSADVRRWRWGCKKDVGHSLTAMFMLNWMLEWGESCLHVLKLKCLLLKGLIPVECTPLLSVHKISLVFLLCPWGNDSAVVCSFCKILLQIGQLLLVKKDTEMFLLQWLTGH